MKIPIDCKPLDELLGGGIESGSLTSLYGEAGSGKTNICLQLARNVVLSGKKVVFIDTEGVSFERLKQICSQDFDKVTKGILFFTPYSLEEQEKNSMPFVTLLKWWRVPCRFQHLSIEPLGTAYCW